ncbi:MAG: DegV family protein [Anaerolineales bacterium]|jgi:DegV family protein with EDD domain
MNPIALITDSTCDIPQGMINRYGISVIPLGVVWGDELLHDRVDLTPEEFYQRLESDPIWPTSTLPTPDEFEKVYRDAIEAGAQEIVVMTVSSAMSGTFQLAEQVGRNMDVPVHAVDSKGPTMSLGWQVLAAARIRELGGSAAKMIEAAASVREKLVQIVCLDTLEYLHRGGRIGNAAHFFGSLLDIKPLVKINHKTGLVEFCGQARTRKKSIESLVSHFFEQLSPEKPKRIAVLHGGALSEAQALADRIMKEYNPLELLVNITGPVLGIHTGPRALALCGYAEE